MAEDDAGYELLDRGGGEETVSEQKVSMSTDVLNLTLHQCARDGDENKMDRLLHHLIHLGRNLRKKINQFDEDGFTPLHYAARYNFIGVVRILVENGADVNIRGDDDVTPLHHAARYRRGTGVQHQQPGLNGIPLREVYESEVAGTQDTVIQYLSVKGAQVNAKDCYGQTPLHYAAMRGSESAARDLLSIRDIDIEAQDKQGIRPLHMAAIHSQVEVTKTLLEHGANLLSADKQKSTALHMACADGNLALVQALFEAGAKSADAWAVISRMVTNVDIEGSTCLHRAVDCGHFEVAKLCLEKRAEVNRPRKHDMYPLHLAAMSGDIRIARLLVENDARIDAVNVDQATALHKAAALNHVDVVKFLVEKGSSINRRDRDNYTPLLLAACHGHVETLELLLHKGANHTIVDRYDRSPIYLAAEENKLQVLEKLLSHPEVKRQINTSDMHGATPLHVAAQKGYLDIVKCLLRYKADLHLKNEDEQTPIHLAAKFGRTSIIREMVLMDKSVLNAEDENSNTALHLAAQHGHNMVAAILLELGADISARNYNQQTPLDLAASKGWTKTCCVLLSNDAPVDPIDKNKTTPLHLAARCGHVRVVDLLLAWKADVSLEDDKGCNCLDLAIDNNHVFVAMTIINSSVWKEALRNSTADPLSTKIDTPMRKLIKKMPEVAARVFDRCLSYGSEKNPERPDYEITFNYEFLDDTYMPWINNEYRRKMRSSDTISLSETMSIGSVFDDDDRLLRSAKPYIDDSNILKDNHPLFLMVSREREGLLSHPLVSSLLNHKWSSFGRYFYYGSLFIYAVFLVFLTGYVVLTDPPESYNSADMQAIQVNNCTHVLQKQKTFCHVGTYIIMALAVINLLKELLQIYQAKLAYLGWTNLIEWTTYITALLLVISFNECQRTTGYRHHWQWSLGAISIFLAWINLVLFIQKFPNLGIFVVMFTDVLYTFIHFFIVFFLFIVAFALAFFCIFQQQQQQGSFTNVGKSLIKTSVMMIGEFEFDTIFNSSSNQLAYPEVSYIIFVIFLVIMSILLMNLLVGLAVDDIKAVQEQAALKRMAMQVELALDVERVIPDFIRRRFYIKHKTVRPNVFNNSLTRIFPTQAGLTVKSLQRHLHPNLGEMERVQETQQRLNMDVKKLKRTVKELHQSSQRLESMLKAVISHGKVNWHDEDFQQKDEVEQIQAGLAGGRYS